MLVYFISFVHFLLFALLKEIQKWEEKKLITNPQKKWKKSNHFCYFYSLWMKMLMKMMMVVLCLLTIYVLYSLTFRHLRYSNVIFNLYDFFRSSFLFFFFVDSLYSSSFILFYYFIVRFIALFFYILFYLINNNIIRKNYIKGDQRSFKV